MKSVLIVEHCLNGLKLNESVDTVKKNYNLSGTFTEFDVENRNKRIYRAQNFVPHLNKLLEQKQAQGVIFGAYDHPDAFETSMSRVSHSIEKLVFNKERNLVEGEIHLMSTKMGLEARSIVDEGYPLFISSRAAGVTGANGVVELKQLFTYDIVADAGFSNAKLFNKSLNESLGFNNDYDSNFRIYDMGDYEKINELHYMENNEKKEKTLEDLSKFNESVTAQILEVEEKLNKELKEGYAGKNEILGLIEQIDTLKFTQDKIIQYLDNIISEKIKIMFNELTSTKKELDVISEKNENLNEEITNVVKFAEHIAEHTENNTIYLDYLALTEDQHIEYTKYVTEKFDKAILFMEHIAENAKYTMEYAGEYMAEKYDNLVSFVEYIAEHVDIDAAYTKYLAEHLDNSISYSENIANESNHVEAYTKYIAEGVDNVYNIIKTNKLFENANNPIPNMKDDVNIQKYYDENEEEVENDDDLENDEKNIEDTQKIEPVEIETETEVTEPIETQEVQETQDENTEDVPTTVEGEKVETEDKDLIPGVDTVKIELNGKEQIANVLSYNPNNGYAIVQIIEDGKEVELHESLIKKLPKINEELNIKSVLENIINEAKKQKVSQNTTDPDYVRFLTEKNKNAWFGLSKEDRDNVTFAIKESNTIIYSESQLLNEIRKALTVQKSFEEQLMENMPVNLKDSWLSLNEAAQKDIIYKAKNFFVLDNNDKIVSYWNTRDFDSYLIKESKVVLNDNITDEQANSDEFVQKVLNDINRL